MISFKCSQCEASLKVKDSLAGRKGKCPKCGAANAIPEPSVFDEDPFSGPGGQAKPESRPPAAPAATETEPIPMAPLPPQTPSPNPMAGTAAPAEDGDPFDFADAPAGTAEQVAIPAKPVRHVSGARSARRSPPPGYVGLQVVGTFFIVIAILTFLGGGVFLVLALANSDASDPDLLAAQGLGTTVTAILIAIGGFLYLALGLLCHCFRDIARNTHGLRGVH